MRVCAVFCVRKGSPGVVDTTKFDVAGFVAGVTVGGVKATDVLPGRPLTVSAMGFVNALFCGVTVSAKLAICPALTVTVVGLEDRVKSGGKVTVVTSDAVSLAGFDSPPPETRTTVVTLAAEFSAARTVTATGG